MQPLLLLYRPDSIQIFSKCVDQKAGINCCHSNHCFYPILIGTRREQIILKVKSFISEVRMKNIFITVACLAMLSCHSLSEAALVTKYFESTVTEANGVTLNFLGVGDIFSWNVTFDDESNFITHFTSVNPAGSPYTYPSAMYQYASDAVFQFDATILAILATDEFVADETPEHYLLNSGTYAFNEAVAYQYRYSLTEQGFSFTVAPNNFGQLYPILHLSDGGTYQTFLNQRVQFTSLEVDGPIPTPEPLSSLLFGAGLIGLIARRTRKR